jgi:hypothetical protein
MSVGLSMIICNTAIECDSQAVCGCLAITFYQANFSCSTDYSFSQVPEALEV